VEDGESGLLVPERDPVALAEAMERLASDPALAERLAAAGRRAVEERFDRRRNVARLAALFAEVDAPAGRAAGRAAPVATPASPAA
jgi:glycosyltransferase involved in cell wall biosynthesis